jgi:hypothetical protein
VTFPDFTIFFGELQALNKCKHVIIGRQVAIRVFFWDLSGVFTLLWSFYGAWLVAEKKFKNLL